VVKPRYRGENSNIEDIATRFDKHLADPEPASLRLTASASIVKCAPGRYKVATVLNDLVKRDLKYRNKRLPPKEKKPRYITKREKERRWREREWRDICALPDDERELWNRCSL
jgi:hypothetical protein